MAWIPPGRLRMIQLVKEIRDTQEINLIISSHLLRDVEECCDEVMIMKDGRIVQYCNLEEQRRANRKFLQLETRARPSAVPGGRRKARVRMRRGWKSRRIKMVMPETVEIRNLYELAQAHADSDPPLGLQTGFAAGHFPEGDGEWGCTANGRL